MAKKGTKTKKAVKKTSTSKLDKILNERYGTTDVSKENVTRALNERGLTLKDVKN